MSAINNSKIYKIYFFVLPVIFILLLGMPLVLKGIYVDSVIYSLTGIRFHGGTQVLLNDAIIYFCILLLFYVSFIPITQRSLSIILRVLAFFIFGLYAIDYIIIKNFSTHLVVNDVMKYASYTLRYMRQIYHANNFIVILMVLTVTGIVSSIVFTRYRIRNIILHTLSIIFIAVLLLTSFFTSNEIYVHSWVYKNFVDYNLTILSESNEYSSEFTDNFEIEDEEHCYKKAPESLNVIVLMVESLSSYQSRFFSGIKDWTPNIDQIARSNISYKNFYANGFTTEDGEIALLTGLPPIYPPSSYKNGGGISFHGFYGIEESLPNILKNNGLTTEFLTTADLEFANTGVWARSIGFDYIEGSEHPYYKNWDRAHFNAAPDEALYNRVLSRVKRNSKNKYFIFIKTVSSHHPFKDPENKNNSEAGAFMYADRQIGLFHKKLIEAGFFDQGILVIVGDHHAMIPLKKEEVAAYGSLKAAARVPMIVSYGGKKHSIENEQFQQIDIFNSLKSLTSNTQCYTDWHGDIFSQGKKTAEYIVHRRGGNRNIISIFSGNKNFLVKLDGDKTRIITSDPVDRTIRELLVKKVNAARILRKGKTYSQTAATTSAK